MIPVKLAMRNFMCYHGDVPPLFFEGIHTACISGDNGHGKSALIDAITWALWGKARARSDDDLIRLGQAEMEVEFEFAVAEQPYRIIRKHSRPKQRSRSGQTSLDLFVANENGFTAISGNNITQTQQKINGILHMNYETFINSAYLRQGHADEFTLKKPTERKEVLAEILGLSFYDELEEQAKELARQDEAERAALESAIADIDTELAQLPAYEAEFQRAESQLAQIEEVMKEHESRLSGLRQERDLLENKRQQLTQWQEHIAKTGRDLERWQEQVRQHQARLKEYEQLLAQRSAIEQGHIQFIQARNEKEELDQKLRFLAALNERKHRLEMAIAQAEQVLLKDHAVMQSKIMELEAASERLTQYQNGLQQVQSVLSQLAGLEETLRSKRQNGEELQAQVHLLESNSAQLQREIQEIAEKLDLLLIQSGPRCPLCSTELGTDGIEQIKSKYNVERQGKAAALQSNQTELAGKKAELESAKKDVFQLETRLNQEKTAVQSRASVLAREIAEAREAGERLGEEGKRLAEIEERLARRDFASVEQEALRQLENELVTLSYDPQRHEEVRQRLAELEQYEHLKRRLEEAERLINQERDGAAQAEEAAQELQHRQESDSRKAQELALEINLLPQIVDRLTQAETELQALQAQQRQAQETIWAAREKLNRCSELEVKKREKGKLMAQAAKQEEIYRQLAQAFGKRGVQALLIEMALPDIEEEANRLLARMTDNRMHAKIETQRQTRKGDLLETLDINISDELGLRSYEMYSGGEAFRIDFAIRIALSKLLARRAGAPLPTLVIDEGFGTQDSVGLEKIKEAINSIQDDFQKILVITHLEELKDAFPTRIDVVKTAEGSTIEVS
ncbi:AAA family ATPase [Chloroflexota bacterium]